MHGGASGANDSIWFDGTCPVHNRRNHIIWSNEAGQCGIRYQMRLKVQVCGGTVCADKNGTLHVDGAESAVLLLAIRIILHRQYGELRIGVVLLVLIGVNLPRAGIPGWPLICSALLLLLTEPAVRWFRSLEK